MKNLLQNLVAGYRLAVLRPVRRADFAISVEQLILLNLLGIALTAGIQYLSIAGAAEFSYWSLLRDGSAILLFLLAVWMVVAISGKAGLWLDLALSLSSMGPLFSLLIAVAAYFPLLDYPLISGLPVLLLFAWYLLACGAAIRQVLSIRAWPTLRAMVVLILVSVAPFLVLPEMDYWYAADYELEAEEDPVNVEDAFYAQWGLLDDAVRDLQPQRPGVVDLFHVGFGSYAWQAVFMREVKHVQHMLDERFDTRGRSVTLINHKDTLHQTPIASASNLALLLNAMAERMDVEEDVLFLYLTSHGSKGAELSVDFWPLELNQISAGQLRAMLDAAGIRWRVVVISACYSGSFVDQLQEPGTLVITAADRDRTSFGCSNENEYTYFGEAYFKHALNQTFSFTKAFELARQWILAREQKEGLEHSRPMMSVGTAIAAHLALLEQRLSDTERRYSSALLTGEGGGQPYAAKTGS